MLLVLTTHHYLLLQRNLPYTALTRGRRLVVLLGSKKALAMAIKNDQQVRRYTDLTAKICRPGLPLTRISWGDGEAWRSLPSLPIPLPHPLVFRREREALVAPCNKLGQLRHQCFFDWKPKKFWNL